MTDRIALMLTLACFCACSNAGEAETRAYVDSIKSVEQVKKEIREALTETCGTGHCWNSQATRICNAVGALDVKLDYAIAGTFTTPKPEAVPSENRASPLKVSNADLGLMKLIFSQCKPTNYQYWSFGSILHVIYAPTPKVDAEVRKRFGIKD
jgi:hypothetical protein